MIDRTDLLASFALLEMVHVEFNRLHEEEYFDSKLKNV